MIEDVDVLKSFMGLPPEERAAALAHWIYVQTSLRKDSKWPLRVAESWNDLAPAPKEFNILTIDTWSKHPKLLEAWLDAVNVYRVERESGERKI
jgi:hypothetical protein